MPHDQRPIATGDSVRRTLVDDGAARALTPKTRPTTTTFILRPARHVRLDVRVVDSLLVALPASMSTVCFLVRAVAVGSSFGHGILPL